MQFSLPMSNFGNLLNESTHHISNSVPTVLSHISSSVPTVLSKAVYSVHSENTEFRFL